MKPSKEIKAPERTRAAVVAPPKRSVQFIPLGDRVSVRKLSDNERFVEVGGVIVDSQSIKMLGYGETTVIEAGPGCVTVKKGDRICCNVEQVREVKVGDESFFVINEMAIMAILRESAAPNES